MTLSIENSSCAQQQRCESWMGMAGCPMCCARCLDEGIMRYFRQFQVTHGSYNPFFVYLISTFGFCESFPKQRCKGLAPFTGDQRVPSTVTYNSPSVGPPPTAWSQRVKPGNSSSVGNGVRGLGAWSPAVESGFCFVRLIINLTLKKPCWKQLANRVFS